MAGSAGQEYVDNIFYNHNNDYEMATLNRSGISKHLLLSFDIELFEMFHLSQVQVAA